MVALSCSERTTLRAAGLLVFGIFDFTSCHRVNETTMKSACILACLISSAQAYQPSPQAGLSRRRVFEGLGWTGAAAVVGAPTSAFAAAKAAPAAAVPLEAELVKKGDGPLVKDGDYAFVDFTGWLDGFAGKEVIDSSNANGGQAVKVPIGPGDTTPQGLLANVGRGGTVAKPVIVPMPIGINEILSNGAAPRNPDGTLAIQGSTKDYQVRTKAVQTTLLAPLSKSRTPSGPEVLPCPLNLLLCICCLCHVACLTPHATTTTTTTTAAATTTTNTTTTRTLHTWAAATASRSRPTRPSGRRAV